MSHSQYTPGPWRIHHGTVVGQNGSGRVIATLKWHEKYAAADANLISAAPDLLAALRALVEHGTDSPQHLAAERAIAKAEGLS